MYLLPANTAPRSKTKWGGLGALPAVNGRRMTIIFPRPAPGIITVPLLPLPPQPGPMPTPRCVPGDVRMENAYWDSTLCRWVPNSTPVPLPIVRPPIPIPVPVAPIVVTPGASTAGTPVPPSYPTNQFFVAPDGSVWEYSSSSGKWFNTGTPYNTGAT